MMSAEQYRVKAQAAFATALLMDDPEAKALWERTARRWEALAAMATLQDGLQTNWIDPE